MIKSAFNKILITDVIKLNKEIRKRAVPRDVRNSKVRNKTCSEEIGFNIRTLAIPKVGQHKVFGGVSVPCRHATSVADAPWKPIFCEMQDAVKW